MKDIQKAIKHFECVRDAAVAVLDSGFGKKPNESDSLYKNRKLYYELAISALEKQMPKRPIEDGYYDEPSVCPNCGGNVINQCDNDYQFQCCHYCGQKLDWSHHPTEKGGDE